MREDNNASLMPKAKINWAPVTKQIPRTIGPIPSSAHSAGDVLISLLGRAQKKKAPSALKCTQRLETSSSHS